MTDSEKLLEYAGLAVGLIALVAVVGDAVQAEGGKIFDPVRRIFNPKDPAGYADEEEVFGPDKGLDNRIDPHGNYAPFLRETVLPGLRASMWDNQGPLTWGMVFHADVKRGFAASFDHQPARLAANAYECAKIWETVRDLAHKRGVALEVTNVWRSARANGTIKGAATASRHLECAAIDFVPPRNGLAAFAEALAQVIRQAGRRVEFVDMNAPTWTLTGTNFYQVLYYSELGHIHLGAPLVNGKVQR